jgi:hypothetical protein
MSQESYLNDYVKSLIDSINHEHEHDDQYDSLIWIDPVDFILNFEHLASTCIKHHGPANQTTIDLHQSSTSLSKLIRLLSTQVTSKEGHRFKDYKHTASFIDNKNDLNTIGSVYDRIVRANDDHLNYESLLFMFVVFERNLRMLVKQFKPNEFLLRDLISNEGMETDLTKPFVDVLKLLLGSPLSLNLRNLVWHGFLQASECSKHYSIFLALIFNFVGLRVEQSKMQRIPTDKLFRRQLSVYNSKLTHALDYFRSRRMNVDDQTTTRYLISTSLVSETRRKLLTHAFNLNLINKNYVKSIVLILPQLEFLLRKLFVIVNNLDPKHNLCAQERQFYLTMNELLAERVSWHGETANKNLLAQRLGESCLLVFYDVFMFEDGVRLRDRLSHGEYELTNNDDWKVYSDLVIQLACCLLADDHDQTLPCDLYTSVWHPLMCVKNELLDQFETIGANVEFNSNPVLIHRVLDLLQDVHNDHNDHRVCVALVANLIRFKLKFNVLYLYSNDTDDTDGASKALYLKYINLVRVLVGKCKSILKTLDEFRANTLGKLKTKQLHSRNRLNFELFQKSYDFYSEVLLTLLSHCFYIYLLLGYRKANVLEFVKFWKLNNNLLIHFDKLLHLVKLNRWTDCTKLFQEFYSKINDFYI